MTCRDVIEFLEGYVSGDLPAEERAVFDAHLAICPWCVAYLKTYEETIKLGKGAVEAIDEPVPEELVKAILAARKRESSS